MVREVRGAAEEVGRGSWLVCGVAHEVVGVAPCVDRDGLVADRVGGAGAIAEPEIGGCP